MRDARRDEHPDPSRIGGGGSAVSRKLAPEVTERATSYQQLSIADKRRQDLAKMREPAITCPVCDTQVMPVDLLSHLERCERGREPGPGAKWITWKDAIALVPSRTLKRWVRRGHVRFKGGRGDRLYLARDLIVRVAQRKVSRRR
jgi:hypothetical protein